MNAVNPLHAAPSQRALDRQADRQSDRQAEPSMEEILASIRRIIADDQALPQHASDPVPPAASVSPLRDVRRERGAEVVRDEDAPGLAAYGQVTAPQFPSPEGPSAGDLAEADDADHREDHLPADVAEHDMDDAAAAGEASPRHSDRQDHPMRDPIARESGHDGSRDLPAEPRSSLFSQATDASLSSAFNMLAATRLADDSDELRAMARDMIRPLLKSWLDDNLPSLVERLVRAEIERVARGGR